MERHCILVTGGCGFIGNNFIRYMLAKYDYRIVNFDKLTYAGNLENLNDVERGNRYTFVRGDIGEREDLERAFAQQFDCVVPNLGVVRKGKNY